MEVIYMVFPLLHAQSYIFTSYIKYQVASNQEAKLMCQTAVTVMQLELSQLPEVKVCTTGNV